MIAQQILMLLGAFALVLVNGWFVLAEFALVRVRRTQLQERAEAGDRSARLALQVTGNLQLYLSAIQLGITFASLGLGWIGEPAIARLLHPLFDLVPGLAGARHGVAAGIAFFIITYLHVVLGEMAPKTLAIAKAELFAMWVARPLHIFCVVTYPLIMLLQLSANRLVQLLGVHPTAESAEPHSPEELRMIVAASHKQGVLGDAAHDLIDNVFVYTDRVAREVMTPRRDVVVLSTDMPVEKAIALAIEKEYTRYPLVGPGTDHVIGFIHIKDLVPVATGRRQVSSLRDLAREPVFVPETVAIDKVRRQLQARKTHFGVVVDEFGDFTGIVTLEDLLEELVGEIQDELDAETPKILRRPDGSADVDAGILVETACKRLGLVLEAEVTSDVDTLGGYVFSRLGRTPEKGDAVTAGAHRLEVLEVNGMGIRRLRVTRPEPPAE